MTDIIFYDFDFNRLRDFAKPISVNIERKYCGFGSAELHFDICNQDLIQLLDDNKYLFFVTGEYSAIVTGWQLGEDIAIYGRTLEWLLTKRGVEAFSCKGQTAEEIVRTAVENVADFVVLGEALNVGEAMDYSTEDVRSLYDVVCEVLASQGLGFRVTADIASKAFVFGVYSGEESLCMFSTSNRTAYDVTYSTEIQNTVTNSGWYERRYKDMGGWDAVNNRPGLSDNLADNSYTFYRVTSSQATTRFGLTCSEGVYLYCDNPQGTWRISDKKPNTIWLYIDNPDKSGLKKWDAVLKGIKTEDEAKTEIAQMTTRTDIDFEAYRFEYGKDYQLGDVVRTQVEFGEFKKSERKRVASVIVYSDTDKSGVSPILESLEE